jgi:hypothetical protein
MDKAASGAGASAASPDWLASTSFKDGFEMARETLGDLGVRDWLSSPDGTRAYWDAPTKQWMNADGSGPMPVEWSAGHAPGGEG